MNDMMGGPAGRTALIERAKAILAKPKEEWPKIAAEPTSIGDVLKSYALPLLAIGPIAAFIGSQGPVEIPGRVSGGATPASTGQARVDAKGRRWVFQ